jgi:amidase
MIDLVHFTATELVAKMHSRELSALEVFDAHARVIESTNAEINAMVTLCLERALDEAKLADKQVSRNDVPAPLHGLPFAVKDTLPTKDVRTTYGSLLFENHIPQQDALHVARARRAGAVVVGKTNTPEFASGVQTDNPVFGLTRNPLDLTKTVTGSSGGAAAALAAHMVPMADGSDLGGSLRVPASVCGVVGFRPTAGQLPKRNAPLPLDRLHVFGPMARSVEDIALFMSVFAGMDPACPLSAKAVSIDYSAALEVTLSGTRIAFSATPCGTVTNPEVQQILKSQLGRFESMGCIIDSACPEIEDNHAAHYVTAALNAVSELAQYLDDDRFGQSGRLRMFLEKGQSLTPEEIAAARRTQARCWQVLREFFLHYDFLLWPTMAGLPYDADLAEADVDEDWRPVELTPSLNLPAISLPAGLSSEGLPIGLQIIGPPNSDFRLLQLAFGFQQSLV